MLWQIYVIIFELTTTQDELNSFKLQQLYFAIHWQIVSQHDLLQILSCMEGSRLIVQVEVVKESLTGALLNMPFNKRLLWTVAHTASLHFGAVCLWHEQTECAL